MTENEAIKGLETLKYQCKHNGECGTCNICCSSIPLAIQALEQIQLYRAIGTIEEFKALKEKNVAKKPIGEYTQCKCSVCGRRVRSGRGSSSFVRDNFCQRCGQKLDWQ